MAQNRNISAYRWQQLTYVIADVLSSIVVWLLFLLFRWLVYEGRLFSVDSVLIPAFNFYEPLIWYPIYCLIIYYLSGAYLHIFDKTYGKELLNTLLCSLIIAIGAFFFIIIDDKVDSYHNYYTSFLVLFLLQFFLSYPPRLCITAIGKWRIGRGKIALHTVIIGTEKAIYTLKERMPDVDTTYTLDPQEIVTFPTFQGQNHINRVIIASNDEKEVYRIIHAVYPYRVDISFPPRVYDMLTGAAKIRQLTDTPLVTVTEPPMNDVQLSFKRAFDIVASLVCLLVLSPVFLLVAIAVKADSHGPVLYKQERIGLYGRPFHILKFRTMIDGAEKSLPQLAKEDDPRITRVGRILRKYRLNELPQFWNILRGDMSIVGPRPERAYYIDKIAEQAPYYCLLYKIRPGLTSWGPIRVGYTDTLEKMIQRLNYDIVYMENMSLLLDVKIMLHTLKVIVDGKGQ